MAVEEVVAEHQGARAPADEVPPEDEGLRQAVGAGLHAVLQVQAPARAVAQQGLEARRVLRRADDEHVADAGQHQRAERVVDHRLVVDGQQLLAHRQRRRVQAGAGATGQDDAFACFHSLPWTRVAASFKTGLRLSILWTPADQWGNRKPNDCRKSCVVSSLELSGRRAGVGNADVGTGRTVLGDACKVTPACSALSDDVRSIAMPGGFRRRRPGDRCRPSSGRSMHMRTECAVQSAKRSAPRSVRPPGRR